MYALDLTQKPLIPKWRRVTRPVLTWKEELYAAMQSEYARANGRPLYILFSGGIDSEVMCILCRDLGIPYTPLIFRHSDGSNDYDIKYALDWCAANKVHYKVINFSFDDFIFNEVPKIIESGWLPQRFWFRMVRFKYIETLRQLGGYGLVGGTELCMESRNEGTCMWFTNTGHFDMIQHQLDNNIDFINFYFYWSTPELVAATIQHPIFSAMWENPKIKLFNSQDTNLIKRLMWHHEFKMTYREKYGGTEQVNPTTVQFYNDTVESKFKPSGGLYFLKDMKQDLGI